MTKEMEDLREAIIAEIGGGPKAKGIATYDTHGRLIDSGKGPKAVRPKRYEAKKRTARKRSRKSRRRNWKKR